jgi:hypothetical protein
LESRTARNTQLSNHIELMRIGNCDYASARSDIVLVQAAAGGVGLALATASTKRKLLVARSLWCRSWRLVLKSSGLRTGGQFWARQLPSKATT